MRSPKLISRDIFNSKKIEFRRIKLNKIKKMT
jgi:hypothetical protein